MDFVLTNKPFENLGLGSLKYLSNYNILQKEQYPHDYFKEALNLMLRTNLKNRSAKPILIIRSEIEGVQMFDQEFLLHLQNMSPDLLFYGKDILKQGAAIISEKNENRNECEEEDFSETEITQPEPESKQEKEKDFYSSISLYRCSYEMPRNRYLNIVYKIIEVDEIPDFYCQIYYCGPNLFSRELTQKLTFKLSPFLQFLENNSDTLHLYFNARAFINKRFGRSTYYLQNKKDVEGYFDKQQNFNKRFISDNHIETTASIV